MSSSSSSPSQSPASNNRELIGVVLAGGGSRRLGRDKTRLEIDGETLVDRAARKLAAVCARVLVADGGRGSARGAWSTVMEGPGAGPAAGILGAAQAAPRCSLLVLACDLPLVPPALLAALAHSPERVDWALPFSRREDRLHPEPLCSRYGPRVIAALAARVARGELALHPLAGDPALEVRRFEPEELSAWGDPDHLLLNVNRPGDLELLERILKTG
jgi:molybdopterin-guanine dinucleotide biosynthesis protein A